MAECLFCRIVSGSIPAKIIYKGLSTVAFLDIRPLAKGHTLVVPMRHAAKLEDMTAEQFAQHMSMVPRIVKTVCEAVGAKGATLAWNNGPAAGQEVGHVHLHIVPRFDGDKAGPIHGMFVDRPEVSAAEMDALAAGMKKRLGG